MSAPSSGQPVTITVAAVWRLQVKPQTRPPRLTVGATIGWGVFTTTRIIFGAVYLKECPQQPNIPSYLLGLALLQLLMVPFLTFSCESDEAHPQQQPRGVKACLGCIICLFYFTLILAGDVWILSVYKPNYDPATADGLYCDKNLYTFAFWNAVMETFGIGLNLAKLCKGLLCCVMMSPAQANDDFYRNV